MPIASLLHLVALSHPSTYAYLDETKGYLYGSDGGGSERLVAMEEVQRESASANNQSMLTMDDAH